jgi:hypothetical protein
VLPANGGETCRWNVVEDVARVADAVTADADESDADDRGVLQAAHDPTLKGQGIPVNRSCAAAASVDIRADGSL